MFLHRPPVLLRKAYGGLTWRRQVENKTIFLTFDDGPIPELTPFVLQELEKYNAQATFFCVGDNLIKHPEIAHDILDKGHSIGNHTGHHFNGWKTDNETYLKDVEDCQRQIAALGVQNNLYRPPYGKIKYEQIRQLKSKYEIIMWDVLSGDYDINVPKERCLSRSIKYTRPGSIIVFHDNIKAERNLKYTLPGYLEHFSNAGFSFRAL